MLLFLIYFYQSRDIPCSLQINVPLLFDTPGRGSQYFFSRTSMPFGCTCANPERLLGNFRLYLVYQLVDTLQSCLCCYLFPCDKYWGDWHNTRKQGDFCKKKTDVSLLVYKTCKKVSMMIGRGKVHRVEVECKNWKLSAENWDKLIRCLLLTSNQIIFPVQFGINTNCTRPKARGVSFKFTCAYLFQFALNFVWLPIPTVLLK